MFREVILPKGIVVNTGYDRATLRANFDSKVNRVLKFGMTLAPSIEWRTGSGQTDGKDRAGMQAIGEPPISDKGVGAYAGLGGLPTYKWSGRYASPIGYLEKVIANRTRNKLNANVYLDFNLTNNLVSKLSAEQIYTQTLTTHGFRQLPCVPILPEQPIQTVLRGQHIIISDKEL
ncbi:hypothetical protein ACFFJX_01455 [Pseudarcicella hirudinis]|uniref:hypothetical protein n=1 Tax=Pseudarcicella hirudinis TaxID=1079859 RepID=UPI0035F01E7E